MIFKANNYFPEKVNTLFQLNIILTLEVNKD